MRLRRDFEVILFRSRVDFSNDCILKKTFWASYLGLLQFYWQDWNYLCYASYYQESNFVKMFEHDDRNRLSFNCSYTLKPLFEEKWGFNRLSLKVFCPNNFGIPSACANFLQLGLYTVSILLSRFLIEGS